MVLGLLPSRRLGAEDKLSHPRATRKWLDSLPAGRPLDACSELANAVNGALKHFAQPDADRAGALVLADRWAGPHRNALLDAYSSGTLADREQERRVWDVLSALQQSLSAAYDALLGALRAAPLDRKWLARVPLLATRRLAQTRHDAVLRTFRYERWIPRRWRQLHELYQWVREQDVHHKPASASGRTGSSPESEYIRVLLTQQLNQGCLAPRDTLRTQRLLAGWSASLRLSRRPRSSQAMAIDTAGQTGLQLPPRDGAPGLLWLDLAPLLARVAGEIEAVGRGRVAGTDGTTQSADERVALLEQLGKLWSGSGGDERPETAAGHGIRVHAAFGLADIERALRREARAGRPAADTGSIAFVEEIEILEVGDSRGAAVDTSDWLVIDRSPTACRMRGALPPDAGVEPGSLVGFRDFPTRRWSIGVVRRMQRAAGDEVELNLQLISQTARRLTLADPVVRRDVGDQTVEGDTQMMERPGRCNVLFLPPGEAPPALPGRSVIVGRKHYRPGKTYWCRIGHNHYSLSLRRALERTADYVWAAIEVDRRR